MQRTYTEEERLTLLRQFMESGKSKTDFSRSVGLSAVSLSNWQERYGFPDPQTLEIIMKEKGIPSDVSSLQEELARLRREKRELEKALEKEKIRSLAFSTLIDLAESTYQLRCQVISTLSQKEVCENRRPSVSFLCDCLGISRQGYYKHTSEVCELDILRTSVVLYCRHILSDLMPRAGMKVLRKRKRPRTTDSRHGLRVYPDMLNTMPKFRAVSLGSMAVADITYVATSEGWAYLSLLTDAATRMIIGYSLRRTLETEGPLTALRMGLDFYAEHGVDLSRLIHHSDRGSQYCSKEYVDTLRGVKASISMTQTGDPLHNALAERMNNTVKNGWLFDCDDKDFGQVENMVRKAVTVYNNIRPHQALGMDTPARAAGM